MRTSAGTSVKLPVMLEQWPKQTRRVRSFSSRARPSGSSAMLPGSKRHSRTVTPSGGEPAPGTDVRLVIQVGDDDLVPLSQAGPERLGEQEHVHGGGRPDHHLLGPGVDHRRHRVMALRDHLRGAGRGGVRRPRLHLVLRSCRCGCAPAPAMRRGCRPRSRTAPRGRKARESARGRRPCRSAPRARARSCGRVAPRYSVGPPASLQAWKPPVRFATSAYPMSCRVLAASAERPPEAQ